MARAASKTYTDSDVKPQIKNMQLGRKIRQPFISDDASPLEFFTIAFDRVPLDIRRKNGHSSDIST